MEFSVVTLSWKAFKSCYKFGCFNKSFVGFDFDICKFFFWNFDNSFFWNFKTWNFE